jgi:hypothetical protein
MPLEQTKGRDEEFGVPPIAVSPITGATGSINWGGLNKFTAASRQVIADSELDDLVNWLPQLSAFQQVPAPSAVIATLAAPALWNYTDILNGQLFTWYLCTNGHIYQVSTAGAIVDLGAGFSTAANSCDVCNWQATQIIISDFTAQKIYAWNGSALTTVFSTQPEQFIAIYAGRLWMADGLVITWTNSGTYNSLAGDSGSYIITDGRCANPAIGLYDFGGSLYMFGSNWMKTINNLQDVGSPAVLTFQQPTLQTQISIINKWSIVEWGANLYFANLNGFWQLAGATPTKISQQLDGFFQSLTAAGCSFTGAYGVVLNMPCLFWQALWAGDGNYTVFGYTMNQLWFRVTPVNGSGAGAVKLITGAVSSAITQNQAKVYYTDLVGNIYDLFGSPSTALTSILNTKLWDFFSKLDFDLFTNVAIQFVIFGSATLTLSEIGSFGNVIGPATPAGPNTYVYNPAVGNWINSAGVQGQWQNAAGTQGTWSGTTVSFYVLQQAVVPFQERNLALNIVLNAAGAVFQEIVISYRKMMVAKG